MLHQGAVDYVHANEQGLRLHSELGMEVDQPVDEDGAHTGIDVSLKLDRTDVRQEFGT